MLDELAIRFGTDKSTLKHGYTTHYERLLGSLREQPIKLLDIGFGMGASVRMWHEYFQQGQIVSLDRSPREPQATAVRTECPRVTLVVGFQEDPLSAEACRRVVNGPFQVICEDGGHSALCQINAFRAFWPILDKGGVYFCEDTILPPYCKEWCSPTMDYFYRIARHEQPGYQDSVSSVTFHACRRCCLIAVTKKA